MGTSGMIIKTFQFKGNGLYRAGTLSGALHQHLVDMPIGEQPKRIERVELSDGTRASLPVIRQAVSSVGKVIGAKFKTRKAVAGDGLDVWRVE